MAEGKRACISNSVSHIWELNCEFEWYNGQLLGNPNAVLFGGALKEGGIGDVNIILNLDYCVSGPTNNSRALFIHIHSGNKASTQQKSETTRAIERRRCTVVSEQ